MSFESVIGQQRAVEVLRRAVYAQRVPQAYLFLGPANVGKTLVARELAKTLNCETRATFATPAEVAPCEECANCRRIQRDIHPDVHLVRPRAKVQAEEEAGGDVVIEGAMITTEQIGAVVAEANLKANQARRKVFIITSAERMNATSANRLLKTLEEPPGETTFILTTQNPGALLPTIISRCQVLSFRPAPLHEAEAALRRRYAEVDPGVLRSVAALSGGRIGWAVHLLEHPEVLALRGEILDLAASLPGREWFESMAVGERIVGAAEKWWLATEDPEFAEKALKASPDRVVRTKMGDVLDILSTWFRDLALLAAAGDPQLVINADRAERLREIAAGRAPARCVEACADLEETRRQLRGNANLRLAAEVLALKLMSAVR